MCKFSTKKLKGLNQEQQLIFIRKWFKDNFVFDEVNQKPIIIKTHDNKRVIFADMEDCHAYTKENISTGNREIDYVRLRYIHLIKETLQLKNNPQVKDGLDIIHNEYRRWYFDTKKNYSLILKRLRGGNFHYVSSYIIQTTRERLKMLRFIITP